MTLTRRQWLQIFSRKYKGCDLSTIKEAVRDAMSELTVREQIQMSRRDEGEWAVRGNRRFY